MQTVDGKIFAIMTVNNSPILTLCSSSSKDWRTRWWEQATSIQNIANHTLLMRPLWYVAIMSSWCWHRFLTHVKEGDSCEGNVADLEETKRYTESESADGICLMDQRNMLWRCWFSRSGARPMESCRWSQRRRRGSGLYENLDDSVVMF